VRDEGGGCSIQEEAISRCGCRMMSRYKRDVPGTNNLYPKSLTWND